MQSSRMHAGSACAAPPQCHCPLRCSTGTENKSSPSFPQRSSGLALSSFNNIKRTVGAATLCDVTTLSPSLRPCCPPLLLTPPRPTAALLVVRKITLPVLPSHLPQPFGYNLVLTSVRWSLGLDAATAKSRGLPRHLQRHFHGHDPTSTLKSPSRPGAAPCVCLCDFGNRKLRVLLCDCVRRRAV